MCKFFWFYLDVQMVLVDNYITTKELNVPFVLIKKPNIICLTHIPTYWRPSLRLDSRQSVFH